MAKSPHTPEWRAMVAIEYLGGKAPSPDKAWLAPNDKIPHLKGDCPPSVHVPVSWPYPDECQIQLSHRQIHPTLIHPNLLDQELIPPQQIGMLAAAVGAYLCILHCGILLPAVLAERHRVNLLD